MRVSEIKKTFKEHLAEYKKSDKRYLSWNQVHRSSNMRINKVSNDIAIKNRTCPKSSKYNAN